MQSPSLPSVGQPVPPLIALRGISKSFPGSRALAHVDMDVFAGEVHAVMGENGAGKSTLMKIIAGVYEPDEGEILLGGQRVQFRHPREAQEHGISIIHQEFNLLPDRTVAQNIFLGREPTRGWLVDSRRMEADTRRLLEYLGAERSISPQTLVGRLSVAQQQTVEIAKALSFDARVVVMDEPTASLANAEVDALFERVRALQRSGIAFIHISHRLDEIQRIAQRITVLKDGERVGSGTISDFSTSQIVSMMVGRELSDYYPPYGQPTAIGEPKLVIEYASNEHIHDINLTVRRGEIVGIAGLEGSGRSELARAIFGIEPFTDGRVTFAGRPVHFTHPRDAIRAGIGFLTEDRKTEGLVLPHSILDNSLLPRRSMSGDHQAGEDLDGDEERLVSSEARRVDLRASRLYQEVGFLSGGNQQKVVLMKWLAIGASFFIFDEPTRGIDVGAKAGIHDLMRELANSGAAILMISSELPEVIGMSDRILVMRGRTIVGEFPAAATEADIMAIAAQTGEAVA